MERLHELSIQRTVREAAGSVCIHFNVPHRLADEFRFVPGQYLTLETEIAGKRVRRPYSICSSVNERNLRVAIKKVPNGVFSTEACESLRAGDVISVMPPRGSFGVPLDSGHAKSYLCIAAGSGITPILSIVSSVLSTEPGSHVTLIYGNQRVGTMLFRDELCGLKNEHLQRFHWINVLSREQQEATVFNGRIDSRKKRELADKHLIDIGGYDEFLLCGPEAMISEVSRSLRAEGAAQDSIYYELFYANAEDAALVVEKHHSRSVQHRGRMSEVSIVLDARTTTFELAVDGSNLLDAALSQGLDVPFSCKGGVCATCKGRLITGEVDMDLNHALSEIALSEGYILTCQAHPVSDHVTIDFDQT